MVKIPSPPAVILLTGSEQFLKEEALTRLKSSVLDEASKDFNFNIFYAASTQAEKVLGCARTAPFLAKRRFVLVRGPEDFSISDQDLILAYAESPQSQTLLVLEARQDNYGQGFCGRVARFSRVIFCRPLGENRLFAWIEAQAKSRAKRITKEAARVLVENLGNNLCLLANSLDVLVLYIGEKEEITAADVARLVGPDLSSSAFELFGCIRRRDKEAAFQILDSLLKEGVNSSQILGAFAHKLISEKGRIKAALFEQALFQLQKTDSDIKTSRLAPRVALEFLVARLLELF
jgi:DNA polymerase-3 subunit delta